MPATPPLAPTGGPHELQADAGRRSQCAIMFLDVVESVRLVESDEAGTIERWLRFEKHVERELLQGSRGRIVKRLGDGMLLEFETVREAIGVAFRMHEFANQLAPVAQSDQPLKLRVAIDYGEVVRNEGDIYGHRVNVAARLMALADADETVVSAQAHAHLTPELDADAEDLGPCYLKNLTEPVRAFRLRPPVKHDRPRLSKGSVADLRPVIAIIPFENRSAAPDEHALGDLLADEIILALSRTDELAVISRLSTAAFRGRNLNLNNIRQHLRPDYVVWGGFRSDGRRISVDLELVDARTDRCEWRDRLESSVQDLFSRERQFVNSVVTEISAVVLSRELRRARSEPFANLQTYTIMLAAIALMHRLVSTDFHEARTLLEAAISRASRQPVAQAWLAKWHVLRVQQGWSEQPAQDTRTALELTRRALNADPESSLALAVDGFIHTNLIRDFGMARERYEAALRSNPNNSLALLLRGMLHAFRDEGEEAVRDTAQALLLSPLDPQRYFYESLAASANLTNRRFKRAAELALRSLRANRTHTSTWRVLAVAQWQLGQKAQARNSVRCLLELEPGLTVEGYRKRAPSAGYAVCDLITNALAAAGVPLR